MCSAWGGSGDRVPCVVARQQLLPALRQARHLQQHEKALLGVHGPRGMPPSWRLPPLRPSPFCQLLASTTHHVFVPQGAGHTGDHREVVRRLQVGVTRAHAWPLRRAHAHTRPLLLHLQPAPGRRRMHASSSDARQAARASARGCRCTWPSSLAALLSLPKARAECTNQWRHYMPLDAIGIYHFM